MSYLVRLLTPEEGEVIDPFAGSGTTGMSAVLEGVKGKIVEKDESYYQIANQRVRYAKTNYQSLREHIYGDPANKITESETEVNNHNFW
jgi:DNA methylase.